MYRSTTGLGQWRSCVRDSPTVCKAPALVLSHRCRPHCGSFRCGYISAFDIPCQCAGSQNRVRYSTSNFAHSKYDKQGFFYLGARRSTTNKSLFISRSSAYFLVASYLILFIRKNGIAENDAPEFSRKTSFIAP
jgi:hypothetical protein